MPKRARRRRGGPGALRRTDSLRRVRLRGGQGPLPARVSAIIPARGARDAMALKRALKCRVRGHVAVVEFDARQFLKRPSPRPRPGLRQFKERRELRALLPG